MKDFESGDTQPAPLWASFRRAGSHLRLGREDCRKRMDLLLAEARSIRVRWSAPAGCGKTHALADFAT
ncbi:MAG: hypothetical protein WKH64_07790 [Chloroflexia bacterium]